MIQERAYADVLVEVSRCPGCGEAVSQTRCDGCGCAVRVRGFYIDRVLGQGGQGRVYLARSDAGRLVALKELAFASAPDAKTIDAFERETALLQQLNHPQVPRFHQSFTDGAGVHLRLYQVQDYVEGPTLLQRLAQGPLGQAELRDIARELLTVLQALHSSMPAIVHRDVKPSNVVLHPSGRVMLVDFGVARILERGETHGSTLVGTFGYMAPEQLGGSVSPASDLYGLGATLLHALVRKEPSLLVNEALELAFEGEPAVKGWSPFLRKLLARNPRHRFASAAQARAALDRPFAQTPRLRALAAALSAISAVTLGAGLLLQLHAAKNDPQQLGVASSWAATPSRLKPTSKSLGEMFEQLETAQATDAKVAALQQLTFNDFSKEAFPSQAVGVVLPLLTDDEPLVHRLALRLVRHPSFYTSQVLETVLPQLNHLDVEIRKAAASVAGDLLSHAPQNANTTAQTDQLVDAALDDADRDVRIFAGASLPNVYPLSPAALGRVRALVHAGKATPQLLAMLFGHLLDLQIGESEALALLKSTHAGERHLGVGALSVLAPSTRAAAGLGEVLKSDEDELIRRDAAMVLKRFGPGTAAPAVAALLQASHDPNPKLRQQAVETLGAVAAPTPQLDQALRRLEDDASGEVREAARAARFELSRR